MVEQMKILQPPALTLAGVSAGAVELELNSRSRGMERVSSSDRVTGWQGGS
jgi:hypothetical protein